jgi:hypothetical protein
MLSSPHPIDGWENWTFWHYSNDVTVPGSGESMRVVGNRFNGTLAKLQAYSATRRALSRASRWDGRFLSEWEVREWLRKAGHLGGAQILQAMLIFSTSKQQTWFVSLPRKAICLLDDANTRKARRLVQFTTDPNDLLPVTVSPGTSSRTSGTLGIGKRRYLYSPSLFPKPRELITKVTDFAQRAAAASADLSLRSEVARSTSEVAGLESAAFAAEDAAEYYRPLYDEYIAAKRHIVEPVEHITFDAFVKRVRDSEAEASQKQGRRVRFQVQLRGNAVALIPVPQS